MSKIGEGIYWMSQLEKIQKDERLTPTIKKLMYKYIKERLKDIKKEMEKK